MESFYVVLFVVMALVLMAAFSSLIAFRFGAPLLLLFLGVGLASGVDGLGIDFSDHGLAYLVGSVALAIILFDSGFHTPLDAFRQAAAPALVLASLGVVITTGLVGLAAMAMLGTDLLTGLLIGAIVASTDAAAVFFLLRIGGVNLQERLVSTLEVESGTNDPMAIFLTLSLVTMISSGEGFTGFSAHFAIEFLQEMGFGLVFGVLGGVLIGEVANRFDEDRGLTPILVLALALLVFAGTGAAGGSGFLAVYVAGLVTGNRRIVARQSVKRFQDGMTWLAQIVMFLTLGLLATPSEFPAILLPALGIAFFLILVARPLAVWFSLIAFRFSQAEISFVAWVGLRGAVSILLGILPVIGKVPGGQAIFNISFIVVLVSLIVQGWTIRLAAKRLKLLVPPRTGPVDRLEVDLPRAAHHELVAYRVIPGSPVVSGSRLPRWAAPSLVVRDGRSIRHSYAGRLKENDLVYIFTNPALLPLLDRLFAEKKPLDPEDEDFFGTFALSPNRKAGDLDQAYGPGLIEPGEAELTLGELIRVRLGGRVDYADRLRLGPLVLIVRDCDENHRVTAVGLSVDEPKVEVTLPLLGNINDVRSWLKARFNRLN